MSVSTSIKAEVLSVCCSGAFRCVFTQCKEGKTSANDLREVNVSAHQSGKGYKAISKVFGVHHFAERKIIHKRITFKIVASLLRSGCPGKFTRWSDCNSQRNLKKTQELHLRLYRPQLASIQFLYPLNPVLRLGGGKHSSTTMMWKTDDIIQQIITLEVIAAKDCSSSC